jgi:hypothetical protein
LQLLKLALQSAEEIFNDDSKVIALDTIISIATKQGEIKLARDTALLHNSDNQKASALALILKTWSNRSNPEIGKYKDE